MDQNSAAGPVRPPPSRRGQGDLPSFDCFLSHNSKDKPAVRVLAAALRTAGVSVWLDEEQLRPGLTWQPELASGIAASRSVAVLVGADGLGPWEGEEQQAALALAVRDQRPVIPVLLPDAPKDLDPKDPRWSMFLANRTWVDLRPDAAAGLDRLIWGITGRRPGARTTVNPDPPRPREPESVPSQTSAAICRQALAAITAALELIPALAAALAKQPTAAGAATAADLAEGLCASHGDFFAALCALETALPDAGQQLRSRGEDLATLRRHALDTLGWMAVTTVLDAYDHEDAAPIRAWYRGGAFHIPLGRSPCVEVLTACWRRGKAEFSTEPRRFDYGRDDITPERFGEIGFEDPRRLDPGRAVDYVWRRVYQDLYREPAPVKLPPAKIRDLRAWLERQRTQRQRRLRLVIDRYDLDEAFAFSPVLQAIHEAIPQIHLLVIDSGADADPGVFVLPASDLAAGIYDCLKTIEGLV